MYEVRDKAGVLKMKVSNLLAGKLIDKFSGHWEKNQTDSNVWKFDTDIAMGSAEVFPYIRSYIWAGDYMYSSK